MVIHVLISILNLKSIKFRELICGKPRILIYRGRIDQAALKKENFTINELQERLRTNNITNIADVEYAILETSGQVTVVHKPEKRNITPEDLGIDTEYEGISYDLVIDWKILDENLKILNKNYEWLKKELKKFKLTPEEALIVTIDGKNNIFCQKKEQKI